MNRFLAEAFGTFCLVFAGCGAIVVDDRFGGVGHVGISLVFGLVVMTMIYSVGNVSGAHLNPAVTLGFFVAGRLEARDVPLYVTAQCLGAVAAAFVLRALFPLPGTLGETLPTGGPLAAGVVEGILTLLLMFVILNVSTGHQEKGIMAGVAVGGTIAFAALLGGPVSGASMNPARSLGPAFVAGEWSAFWIYLVVPVLGAAAAAPLCRWIQGPTCCGAECDTAPEGVGA